MVSDLEMNIFVPQSIQTQIELEEIADVKRQIFRHHHQVPVLVLYKMV